MLVVVDVVALVLVPVVVVVVVDACYNGVDGGSFSAVVSLLFLTRHQVQKIKHPRLLEVVELLTGVVVLMMVSTRTGVVTSLVAKKGARDIDGGLSRCCCFGSPDSKVHKR
ncbi:hypothetical protein MKW98_013826 [Papaver atlanticum]|uniref:Uncharacterized protein n=1 Tax=Papaver atlanticum TaxID=357466 RepID=A0AAD4TDI8_9MAGN|nr:hypothetical protein MKW98_013826 [Papaver atlanticum]